MTNDATPMSTKSHTIILAAGASTRLGQPKQLVNLAGQPLLERICRAALSVEYQAITVVLGAFSETIKEAIAHLPVRTVINEQWATGMGSSIAAGMSELPEGTDAVLLLLCDQPSVTAAYLAKLWEKWQEKQCLILASDYGESHGPPAIFDRKLFAELAALQGQAGAKKLMQAYRSQLELVDFPEGAFDLDTPEDLKRILG